MIEPEWEIAPYWDLNTGSLYIVRTNGLPNNHPNWPGNFAVFRKVESQHSDPCLGLFWDLKSAKTFKTAVSEVKE